MQSICLRSREAYSPRSKLQFNDRHPGERHCVAVRILFAEVTMTRMALASPPFSAGSSSPPVPTPKLKSRTLNLTPLSHPFLP